jgi:hypothetical protein
MMFPFFCSCACQADAGGVDGANASLSLPFLSLDLITDHAANSCATNCADCAAAGQYSTNDGACTGTDRCVSILSRHAGATCQAENEGDSRCLHYQFFCCVHL